MASLLKIGYYSTMINQMRQGPSYNGKRNKAKTLLLWTIISLVENNILKKNIITLEFLEDRYYKILNDFNVPRTVIIYPFFYLKNDGFWHLKWKYDKEAIIQTPTFKFINNNIDYAYFDENFWFLLQDNNAREKIKEVLIKMITND